MPCNPVCPFFVDHVHLRTCSFSKIWAINSETATVLTSYLCDKNQYRSFEFPNAFRTWKYIDLFIKFLRWSISQSFISRQLPLFFIALSVVLWNEHILAVFKRIGSALSSSYYSKFPFQLILIKNLTNYTSFTLNNQYKLRIRQTKFEYPTSVSAVRNKLSSSRVLFAGVTSD